METTTHCFMFNTGKENETDKLMELCVQRPKSNAERQKQFRQNRKKKTREGETLNDTLARKKDDAERAKRYRDRLKLKSRKRHGELELSSPMSIIENKEKSNNGSDMSEETSRQFRNNQVGSSKTSEAQKGKNTCFQLFQTPNEKHYEYSRNIADDGKNNASHNKSPTSIDDASNNPISIDHNMIGNVSTKTEDEELSDTDPITIFGRKDCQGPAHCELQTTENVISSTLDSSKRTSTPMSSTENDTYCSMYEYVDSSAPVQTSALFSKPMETETPECRELIYSFFHKCRLCLNSVGVTNIVETKDLQEHIFVCTGVNVSASDNLPQKICAECLETVERATKLRYLAIMNDKNLRDLFPPESEEATPKMADPLDLDDTKRNINCNFLVTAELEQNYENNNSNCRSKAETSTQTVESVKEKKLSVRKDLFDYPTSSTAEDSPKKSTPNKVPVKPDKATSSTVCVIKTREDYNKHKYRIRNNIETDCIVYECETCLKVFPSWKQLYLHSQFHKKRMACPLDACGKMFAYKADLEKHIRTHTGVKPFTCEICNKSFSQQGTLKSHVKTTHADHTKTTI